MKKLTMFCTSIAVFIMFMVPTQCFAAVGSDHLYEGEALHRGESLTSNNKQYNLIMQEDGNLVLYGRGQALWNSGTHGKAVSQCIMQNDGNLVIYGYPEAIWNSGTWDWPGSYLVLQDDGNLVIYIGRKAIWSTGTYK